jgi:hypothetical protein
VTLERPGRGAFKLYSRFFWSSFFSRRRCHQTNTQDVTVGFVLEAQYFFNPYNWNSPNPTHWNYTWGTGPFVAIEIGGGSTAPTSSGPITESLRQRP